MVSTGSDRWIVTDLSPETLQNEAGRVSEHLHTKFLWIRERVKERDAICNQGSLDRASRRRVSDTSRRTSRETFQSRRCDGHFNEMTAATLHETTESMQTENMGRTEEV